MIFFKLLASKIFINTLMLNLDYVSAQSINKPDGLIIFIALGFLFVIATFTLVHKKITTPKAKKNKNLVKTLAIKLKKNKRDGEFQLVIKNKSKEYIEVSAPELILKGIRTTKKMIVKSNNYPLTISPGTNHSIIFNKKKLITNKSNKNEFWLFKLKVLDNFNNVFQTRYHLL